MVWITVGLNRSMMPASTSTRVSWVYLLTVWHGESAAAIERITAPGLSHRAGIRTSPGESIAMLRKINWAWRLPCDNTLASALTPPGRSMTDFCQGVNLSTPSIVAYAWRSPWWREEE